MSRLRVEDEGPLPFLLVVPENRGSDVHPVLLFLHGHDEGPPTDLRVGITRHGPLRPGNTVAALDKFVIVGPQLPVRGDLWFQHANEVREIIRYVHEEHRGDPDRTYLTGFSFGGNGVFDLALLQPDTWTALWAVDPVRVPPRDPRRPVWLSFGQIARFSKRGFIQRLGLKPALESPDGERVFLDQGASHVGSATLAYQDERIYSWLLARRLGLEAESAT
ncbi:MAG: hypothetical protein HY900_33415 [Deltaproteobacteria bacterium]|nr:hypothetical protein [Deltaproteobacteria bacterium]